MAKLDNHIARLGKVVTAWRQKPYVIGSADCLTFATECELAVTGRSRLVKHLGGYTTTKGAAKALRRKGFETVGDVVAQDYVQIAPSFAEPGDLAEYESDGEMHLAVVLGEIMIGRGETGEVRWPVAAAARAFRLE